MEVPLFQWMFRNRKNIAIGVFGVGGSLSTLMAIRQIPADHIGIVRNRNGGIRPHVFHSTEVAVIIPFWEHIVLMREKPVNKRFIKEFKTSENKDIEARLVITIQPPMHWMPEIFYKFGRDYGRTFLEREATIDFEEVCKRYTSSDLLEEGSVKQKEAIDELQLRLKDAAAFHRLSIVDAIISFVDPASDIDEY
jgi:hypothetical protein